MRIYKEGNSQQIIANFQLTASEYCAGGDRKLLVAVLAFENAPRLESPTFNGSTMGANGIAISISPANLLEGFVGFFIAHASDLSHRHCTCFS